MLKLLPVAVLALAAPGTRADQAGDLTLLQSQLAALESAVTEMRGEHAYRLAALERALRDCACAPPAAPEDRREEESSTKFGGSRSLASVTSAATRLTERSVHTETMNATEVHIWGSLYWHGREWVPFDPTQAPSLAPTMQPTQYAWQTILTFLNGWASYGSSYGPAMYRKDPDGFVHFNGLLKSGTVGVPAFTLDAGFWPDYSQLFVDEANHAIGLVEVRSSGTAYVLTGSSSWTSICNMVLPTAEVAGWISFSSFTNGWQNYDGGYAPLRYYKDPQGVVHLDGLLKSGTVGSGVFACTLPVEYHPSHYQIFLANAHYEAGLIQVRPDGSVEMHTASATWTSFSGFSFFAADYAGWVYPTIGNGWVPYNGGYADARYTKDAHGYVHLDGLIKNGVVSTTPTPIFTFPVGLRPAYDQLYSVQANHAIGLLIVKSTGVVYLYEGSNGWLSLSGLTFFAEG